MAGGVVWFQKGPHARGEGFGLLDFGMVPGSGDRFETRAAAQRSRLHS
jgi:hypothetical protein